MKTATSTSVSSSEGGRARGCGSLRRWCGVLRGGRPGWLWPSLALAGHGDSMPLVLVGARALPTCSAPVAGLLASKREILSCNRCLAEQKHMGLTRESNSEPLAPKARIIPLDQQADGHIALKFFHIKGVWRGHQFLARRRKVQKVFTEWRIGASIPVPPAC